jgi:hypothetical protein
MDKPLNYTPLKKDVLAFGALLEMERKEKELKAKRGYTRAYFISVVFAPLGIYYFIKYVFFSDGTTDDIKAGFISLILTIATLLISMWLLTAVFQGMNTISPGSADMLKQLTIPDNQKEFKNLLN